MKQLIYFFLIFSSAIFSCSSDKLEVKGEPEAIQLAESMIKELGGRKKWVDVESVYIRTVTTFGSLRQNVVTEEWINLSEPKFMNRVINEGEEVIQIVDKNDGWEIRNDQITMLPPKSITDYLNWHDNHLLINLKRLAAGGENVALRMNGDNRFDMHIGNEIKASFQLDKYNLLRRYYSKGSNDQQGSLIIKNYREYEGYKFPLELGSGSAMTIHKTDYFDPSPLPADKAFNISFDPNDYIK